MYSVSEMLSEKGKKLLVVNNYKFFCEHTAKSGKKTWRCTNKKCRAKFFTNNDVIPSNLECDNAICANNSYTYNNYLR